MSEMATNAGSLSLEVETYRRRIDEPSKLKIFGSNSNNIHSDQEQSTMSEMTKKIGSHNLEAETYRRIIDVLNESSIRYL